MSFRSFLNQLFRSGGDVNAVDKAPIEKTVTRGDGGINAKDLIEHIAKALVDHPEDVKVSQDVSENGGKRISVIELSVAKEDLGQVIGKQGRTVTAIRTVLEVASAKSKRHFILTIPGAEDKRSLRRDELIHSPKN